MSKGRMNDKSGILNPRCAITEKDVIDIYKSDIPPMELAEIFFISRSEVYNIKNKRSWKSLTDAYDLTTDNNQLPKLKDGNSKLTAKQVLEIYTSKVIPRVVSELYGLSISPIRHIRNKRSWKELTDFYDELLLDSKRNLI
jgi:hypothetical protein